MSKEGVDAGRRRFLTLTTSAVGAVGAGVTAWPFLASLSPSEKAKALGAPVSVDIGQLEAGQMAIVPWRGRPVWIVRRTPEMLDTLGKVRSQLLDPDSRKPQQPDYIQGDARSIKPEILVMMGVCTHLGCSPKLRSDAGAEDLGGGAWLGGFFCPCHGSKFDLSGRVFAGVPAPLNIKVPPHRYETDTRIVIGEDPVETKGTA
ncbi:MAG: ubiquinol-cytochrome c reductase iron-sulfur subunit [Nevskiales bacterium]|nr:ubiquinol-cytochrome c reductase iron-sulfur subunit [Nevskiales bacterium]